MTVCVYSSNCTVMFMGFLTIQVCLCVRVSVATVMSMGICVSVGA